MDVDPRLMEITDCLYRVAVKAVVVESGKLLMVQEDDDDYWGLPGGGVNYSETAEQALVRELKEELGLDPADLQLSPDVAFISIGAVTHGVPKMNLFYRARIDSNAIEPTHHVNETGWFDEKLLATARLSPSTPSVLETIKQIMNQEKVHEQ